MRENEECGWFSWWGSPVHTGIDSMGHVIRKWVLTWRGLDDRVRRGKSCRPVSNSPFECLPCAHVALPCQAVAQSPFIQPPRMPRMPRTHPSPPSSGTLSGTLVLCVENGLTLHLVLYCSPPSSQAPVPTSRAACLLSFQCCLEIKLLLTKYCIT